MREDFSVISAEIIEFRNGIIAQMSTLKGYNKNNLSKLNALLTEEDALSLLKTIMINANSDDIRLHSYYSQSKIYAEELRYFSCRYHGPIMELFSIYCFCNYLLNKINLLQDIYLYFLSKNEPPQDKLNLPENFSQENMKILDCLIARKNAELKTKGHYNLDDRAYIIELLDKLNIYSEIKPLPENQFSSILLEIFDKRDIKVVIKKIMGWPVSQKISMEALDEKLDLFQKKLQQATITFDLDLNILKENLEQKIKIKKKEREKPKKSSPGDLQRIMEERGLSTTQPSSGSKKNPNQLREELDAPTAQGIMLKLELSLLYCHAKKLIDSASSANNSFQEIGYQKGLRILDFIDSAIRDQQITESNYDTLTKTPLISEKNQETKSTAKTPSWFNCFFYLIHIFKKLQYHKNMTVMDHRKNHILARLFYSVTRKKSHTAELLVPIARRMSQS